MDINLPSHRFLFEFLCGTSGNWWLILVKEIFYRIFVGKLKNKNVNCLRLNLVIQFGKTNPPKLNLNSGSGYLRLREAAIAASSSV